MQIQRIGVYGKLPAHGDFVSRDLAPAFVSRWDVWLQGALESSREQLGSGWLDAYLCAPVWRFVLSAGVVDEQSWMGVLLPSVDRVGRYFPLTLATPFSAQVPATFACLAEDWFQAVESIALTALDRPLDVELLLAELNQVRQPAELQEPAWQAPDPNRGWTLPLPDRDTAPAALGALVGWLLTQRVASYSLWWSGGSEFVQPNLRVAPSLPAMSAFAGLLDDRLQEGYWHSVLPAAAVTRHDVG